MSTFRASVGTLSGSAALPFFQDCIAFLISCLVGLPQLMGRSVSAGGFLGQVCSGVHRFSCSTAVVNVFPSLSLIGLSVTGSIFKVVHILEKKIVSTLVFRRSHARSTSGCSFPE